jgi:cysteinyl-tRNA synthetase
MKIFNTLTRRKEEFAPTREGELKIYTCGPTVYDFAHIGNFRAYVFQDVFKRYVKYRGLAVTHVMNITDVDDKTIKNSQKEGVSLSELTNRYETAFFEDLETLNIEKPDITPRATEHIDDMVRVIKGLMEKGFAYRGSDDSIYFDLSKFKEYGALAKIKPKKQKSKGIKKDEYEKDEARDFALWKAHTAEDGDVSWDTAIGKGRPGWHIECSTMSTKYLGDTFDIHAGGVDLIFPHHENEIAQAQAATGSKFVNFWLHNEHLLVEGSKMSKSLGNYYTLRDLIKKGHDPRAIRFLLLSTHYRRKLNFTFDALKDSEITVNKLIDFVDRLTSASTDAKYSEGLAEITKETKIKFEEAMDNDIDIRHALSAIFELVRETNKAKDEGEASQENIKEIHGLMKEFDSVLGILEEKKDELPVELKELLEKREQARGEKDFKTADEIREELFDRGVVLEDAEGGARWKWKRA